MNKRLLDFRGLSDEEQFPILMKKQFEWYNSKHNYINLRVESIVVLWTQENPIFVEAYQYHRHFRDDPAQRVLKAGVIRRKTKITKLLKQLKSPEN